MASSPEANPKRKLLFEPKGGVKPWRQAWKRILSVSFCSNRERAAGHGVKRSQAMVSSLERILSVSFDSNCHCWRKARRLA